MARLKHLNPKSIIMTFATVGTWHALRTHALAQLNWMESRRVKKSIDSVGPIPWWTYSCTHYLDQVIPTSSTVIEFGGGGSSSWWLNRGNKLTTIETDPKWAKLISKEIESSGLSNNWNLILVNSISKTELTDKLSSTHFDVVINDGLGDREEILQLLLELKSENGMIIWDNSDRVEYSNGLKFISDAGLVRLDFFGLSPINAYCSETSLFTKTFPQPNGRRSKFNNIPN